jgi:hypothetical protein
MVGDYGFPGYDDGGPISPRHMIPADPDGPPPSPRPHFVQPDMSAIENPTPADLMRRIRDMDDDLKAYQDKTEKMLIADRARAEKTDNMLNALMNEIKGTSIAVLTSVNLTAP